MAVEVLFRPAAGCTLMPSGHFRLEPQGGTTYGLPLLGIGPAAGNVPHIHRLEAHVTGLGAAARDRLLAHYGIAGGTSQRDRPLPWPQERNSPPGIIDLGTEATATPIELTVTVGYYDSDPDGSPVTAHPRQASGTIVMEVAPRRTEQTQPDPLPRAFLSVSPEQALLEGDEQLLASLTLTTAGRDPRPPLTTLDDDQDQLPDELRRLLADALAVPARRLPERGPEGEIYWQRDLRIRLDPGTRGRLAGTNAPLSGFCALVTRYSTAAVQHGLEFTIHPAGPVFSGWVCIDFGTSNSAVALFDQQRVRIPVGLPKEQINFLAKAMLDWLSGREPLAGSPAVLDEWQQILSEIAAGLPGADPDGLMRPFRARQEPGMLDILRRIEASPMTEQTHRAIASRINRIMQETFHVPALSQHSVFPVILDQATDQAVIPSDAAIRGLDPLVVTIGRQARNDRRQAEASGTDTEGRYHIGYKQHLGTAKTCQVTLATLEPLTLSYDALIRECWRDLIRLTDAYRERHPERHGQGRIRKAIITYPTVAPPSTRQRIRALAQELGIPTVETSYDEAVAAAVFYLMRELGGEMDFGIESFKARSRVLGETGTRWAQNVLVFDIGGGTTDIALIRLELEDRTEPPDDGATRGADGRYYRMTPTILGSSGHQQLGGDLVTLRTFLGLKTLLAVEVLRHFPDSQRVSEAAAAFDETVREAGPDWLMEVLREGLATAPEERDSTYQSVLSIVERLVPTRWRGRPADAQARPRQCFNLLWDLAEKAKEELGRRVGPQTPIPPFKPRREELEDLLALLDLGPASGGEQRPAVSLEMSLEQFEELARPAIREAAQITRGLLTSRLPMRGAREREPLDWLILSGQTCHLALVDKELRRELEDAGVFRWNPDRVTFDRHFAKLATSVGACWAEHLRVHVAGPREAKRTLRRGASQLHFDIKNLFFYLPCLFEVPVPTAPHQVLFRTHEPLRRLDSEDIGKARTRWSQGAMLEITILRKDFDTQEFAHQWCNFDASQWPAELGMTDAQWRQDICYQVEVDQTLDMRLLLCNGIPHLCVEPQRYGLALTARMPLVKQLQDQWVLTQDLAVGMNYGGHHRERQVIFAAGQRFDRVLHRGADDRDGIPAMVSRLLPGFDQEGRHLVHIGGGGSDGEDWTQAGELARPPGDYAQGLDYYVTLDADGVLTLYAGEVPYWTADDRRALRDQPGRVYCARPDPTRPEADDQRNPFSGIH